MRSWDAREEMGLTGLNSGRTEVGTEEVRVWVIVAWGRVAADTPAAHLRQKADLAWRATENLHRCVHTCTRTAWRVWRVS